MKGGIQLTVLALSVVIIISLINTLTKDTIDSSEQRLIEERLSDIVPNSLHDTQWVDDRFTFQHPALGTSDALVIYPIIKNGNWNGAAITAVAPDGYTGEIQLLIAISTDQSLLGVRVLNHRETPGLGDDIELDKSMWITEFDDQSIAALAKPLWTVKKDGGAFDQFTGATITPRAVVRTVYRVLEWYTQEGEMLLQQHYNERES